MGVILCGLVDQISCNLQSIGVIFNSLHFNIQSPELQAVTYRQRIIVAMVDSKYFPCRLPIFFFDECVLTSCRNWPKHRIVLEELSKALTFNWIALKYSTFEIKSRESSKPSKNSSKHTMCYDYSYDGSAKCLLGLELSFINDSNHKNKMQATTHQENETLKPIERLYRHTLPVSSRSIVQCIEALCFFYDTEKECKVFWHIEKVKVTAVQTVNQCDNVRKYGD